MRRVHQTADGFAGLSEAEKQYFAVSLLDDELHNGGFHQFFFNHSGMYYSYALLGLENMGADESRKLLLRAKHVLFDFNDVPEDTERRRAVLRSNISDSRSVRLEQLDELYGKDPDGLRIRCEAFAQRCALTSEKH